MAEESKLKECSFMLVRYVPDLVRDEGLNIGIFLHSPEEEYLDCLFTDDFRRVKRFHEQADVDLLRELQQHFEQEIKEHENDLASYLRAIEESYSNLIQVTPPRTCLLHDPQEEIQELFSRYVGAPLGAPLPQDTRMRIKQRLHSALKRAGVLDHKLFEKRIPASKWTHEGDPFKFDYGYTPLRAGDKPNGQAKFVHALSLKRDNDLAAVLKDRILKVRAKEPAELTAVVEGLPGPGEDTAQSTQIILEEAQIALQPLSTVEEYAQSVGRELLM